MESRIFTYLGFFVLLIAIPCPATTWIVDDDGPADYDKIQDAINDAVDGDIVQVFEGHYYENIDFRGKAITVTSTDPNDPDVVEDTIIDANGDGIVVSFHKYEISGHSNFCSQKSLIPLYSL